MSTFDKDRVVSLLSEAGEAPPLAVDAIQTHGLRALLAGKPASGREIAAAS